MSSSIQHHHVGVIGAGTATETLVDALDGSGLRVVVFESGRVGGECPFTACMPSKSMLHDALTGTSWSDAVARRDRITDGLDDGAHASSLRRDDVELVRSRAEIVDAHRIEAGGRRFEVDHLVLATGSSPVVPPIDGADRCPGAIWTSDDALTAHERPDSLVVVGGGVIGSECATIFAGFGSSVVLVESAERSLPDAPPEVADVVVGSLRDLGVDVRHGVEVAGVRPVDGTHAVAVEMNDGTTVRADRVLVAVGRRPTTAGLGVERLGLDPDEPLPVGPDGRVGVEGSVWAIGDVAGRGQYTHLANHQARVVADHLRGDSTRTFDEVVVPACMFTDPPFVQVGASWAATRDDPDVVEAGVDLASFPRASTDALGPGHLWVAARRSTGCIVGAMGAGPRLDELVHALVVAIDGRVPVARLRRSMQPFPTVGEILGPVFAGLDDRLST